MHIHLAYAPANTARYILLTIFEIMTCRMSGLEELKYIQAPQRFPDIRFMYLPAAAFARNQPDGVFEVPVKKHDDFFLLLRSATGRQHINSPVCRFSESMGFYPRTVSSWSCLSSPTSVYHMRIHGGAHVLSFRSSDQVLLQEDI